MFDGDVNAQYEQPLDNIEHVGSAECLKPSVVFVVISRSRNP